MKIVKILRSLVSLALCIVAILACLGAADQFDAEEADTNAAAAVSTTSDEYFFTDYEYYGGDAYTGIQQAGADAANNIAILGSEVVDAANAIVRAQKETTNNVAELAIPLNATTSSVAAIGVMLSNALAIAFGIAAVKFAFDVVEALLEPRKQAADNAAPAAENA